MAKIALDPAFKSFRGGLGNFVYRKTSDGIIAAFLRDLCVRALRQARGLELVETAP